MATVNMSVRMDTELKKQAEALLSEMGLNMTTAMNLFLRQVVRQGRIPFEIALDKISETEDAVFALTDEEKIDVAAKRVMERFKPALEVLAK